MKVGLAFYFGCEVVTSFRGSKLLRIVSVSEGGAGTPPALVGKFLGGYALAGISSVEIFKPNEEVHPGGTRVSLRILFE